MGEAAAEKRAALDERLVVKPEQLTAKPNSMRVTIFVIFFVIFTFMTAFLVITPLSKTGYGSILVAWQLGSLADPSF